jgi:Holliday junction resolvase
VSYYAKRVDSNQCQVIEALTAAGWYCLNLSRAGFGAPDVVAVRDGRVHFIEIKDGTKPPSARKLTRLEEAVRLAFAAAGVPVMIVTSVEEALALR